MAITVNGKEREHVEGETVAKLLKRLRFMFPLVVVKVNDQVVAKEDFGQVEITEGARVEVIHLISGG